MYFVVVVVFDDDDDDDDDDDSLTPLGFPVIPTSFPGPSCSKTD